MKQATSFEKKYVFYFVFLILFLTVIGFSFLSKGTGDVESWQRYVKVSVSAPLKDLIPKCLNYECPFPDFNGTYPPGYILIFLLISNLLPVHILGTFTTVKLIIFFFYILTFLALLSVNILLYRSAKSYGKIIINTF